MDPLKRGLYVPTLNWSGNSDARVSVSLIQCMVYEYEHKAWIDSMRVSSAMKTGYDANVSSLKHVREVIRQALPYFSHFLARRLECILAAVR
jgi:hypothetical protein